MIINKDQLTFKESYTFINNVVNACFEQDENGNDIDYMPFAKQPSIQSNFCEYYTDMEFGDDFDKNFAEYIAVDIDSITSSVYTTDVKFNRTQYDGMLKAIEDGISYRKQKMLQKNIRVTSILDDEIIKFANVLTEVVQNLPKNFDFSSIQPALEKISKMANPDEKKVIEALVKEAKKHRIKDGLRGHLKSKKNDEDISSTEV